MEAATLFVAIAVIVASGARAEPSNASALAQARPTPTPAASPVQTAAPEIPIATIEAPPKRRHFFAQTSPIGDVFGRPNLSFDFAFLDSFTVGPKVMFLDIRDKDGVVYKDESGRELGARVTWYFMPRRQQLQDGMFLRGGLYYARYRVNDDVQNAATTAYLFKSWGFTSGDGKYHYRDEVAGPQGELMIGVLGMSRYGFAFEASLGINLHRKHFIRIDKTTGDSAEWKAARLSFDPLAELSVGYAF